jgi:hypothetical protein
MLSTTTTSPIIVPGTESWSDQHWEELLNLDAGDYHYHPTTIPFLKQLLMPLATRLTTEPDLRSWGEKEAPQLLSDVNCPAPVTVEVVITELLYCIEEALHDWMVRGPYGTELPPDIPLDEIITPWDLMDAMERFVTVAPGVIPRRYWEATLTQDPRSFVRLRPNYPCLRLPVTITGPVSKREVSLNYDEVAGVIAFSLDTKEPITVTVAELPFTVDKVEDWRYRITADDVLFDYYEYTFHRSGSFCLSPSRGFRQGLELAATVTGESLDTVLQEEKEVRWNEETEEFIETVL